MRPSPRLLKLLFLGLISAILLGILRHTNLHESVEHASLLWWLSGGLLLFVAIYDWSISKPTAQIKVERELPAGLAVGTQNPIELTVTNQCPYSITIKLTENVDHQVKLTGLPLSLTLSPNEKAKADYSLHPTRRGSMLFKGIDALVSTRLGLWLRKEHFLEPEDVRVFPNFTAVSNFELLTNGHMAGQMGIHLNQRRGEGLDFHQMREFRPGDSLRQVDWKATSRAMKPISREFQDERDQDIIFLLDNGRKMRAKDGELSHFDHCLNAFLLTAYVALKQGDAIGLKTFGGSERWIAPIKGKNNLNTLMHGIYDLHSSTATSDFLNAAKDLLSRHSKRALIILISNVDEQDNNDLLAAYTLLRRKHLVLFACLRENSIDEIEEQPVFDFMQALRYSSAIDHQNKRDTTLKRLLAAGAIVIDDKPATLHIALVNEYLALKRSGKI
ncbi:MAG: hypothetical protein ACI93R_002768 [Flavobacteriales bacterium]|jgi:uncharacterized protein (DUF58 family)